MLIMVLIGSPFLFLIDGILYLCSYWESATTAEAQQRKEELRSKIAELKQDFASLASSTTQPQSQPTLALPTSSRASSSLYPAVGEVGGGGVVGGGAEFWGATLLTPSGAGRAKGSEIEDFSSPSPTSNRCV